MTADAARTKQAVAKSALSDLRSASRSFAVAQVVLRDDASLGISRRAS